MKNAADTLPTCLPEATGQPTVPFTRYDAGWVVMCIGMAIGSGIIFLPIQMGVKGFWVSLTALVIAYPATYLQARLYLQSLAHTEACDDYNDIITQYLGKNWAGFMGVAYFLMLLKGMLAYSSAITRDSASYLQTYKLTAASLGDHTWYIGAIIITLVLIASRGERLLFRISGPMIVSKLGIIVFLGLSMMPYWNVSHLALGHFPEISSFMVDVLLTLPWAMLSIIYVHVLNPMNVAYRKLEGKREIANYRSLRACRYAYFILVTCVVFFALSFMLATHHEDAVYAMTHNISSLALAARVMRGETVRILATILNVLAIFTAFFGIYLGFHDAVRGIVTNIVDRFMVRSDRFNRLVPFAIAIGTVCFLTFWVKLNISTMMLMQLTVPVFGIVACLIPCYLVRRVPALAHLRTPAWWIVFAFGLLIIASPFFKLLER
ncbi:transporter [Paraburkholderia sp. Ac-20336]|uniref:amino acid permease n=1 Tax=unclassified Paraburkholderia TaxID=2615204 RepID=UPI00141DD95F|nr:MULTISPECIES: amino acid permease [unclassified Paraburkholderia]MBN3804397.1 transporter [Paraburkholderia sp. Ac-20336]MBN3847194.1 transporter [Paraburkholderia sp. Ac-20342]NIF79509.1 transporter [Paraburkholderia sp. Cy-641]